MMNEEEFVQVTLSGSEIAAAMTQLSYPAVMLILEELADYHSDTAFEEMLYDCAYKLRFMVHEL